MIGCLLSVEILLKKLRFKIKLLTNQFKDFFRSRENYCSLILGWRTKYHLKFDLNDTILDTFFPYLSFSNGNVPKVYFHGSPIDLSLKWSEFFKNKSLINRLEFVTTYNQLVDDGNFNSMKSLNQPKIDFSNFRDLNEFHFLTAWSVGPSLEHLKLIQFLNSDSKLFNGFKESLLGWDAEDLAKIKNGMIGNQTYIHFYFLEFLRKFILSDNPHSILEIGGGYGGLASLILSDEKIKLEKYTIIDLPFVSNLQEYYLTGNGFSDIKRNRIDGKVNLIDTDNLCETENEIFEFDILIATHSLSELDPELINYYISKYFKRAKYIFISMQINFHINDADLNWVIKKIKSLGFDVKDYHLTEGGNVYNGLFERNQG